MNFIHHFYPSLMKIPGFLLEFITPIVKVKSVGLEGTRCWDICAVYPLKCLHHAQVTKGKKTLAFYTLPEYEAWKESTNTAGWSVKYYKGLGTSTEKEAKEYFAALDDHKKQFVWTGKRQGCAHWVTVRSGNAEGLKIDAPLSASRHRKQQRESHVLLQVSTTDKPLSLLSPKRRLRTGSSGCLDSLLGHTWTRVLTKSHTSTSSTR